MRFKLFFLLLLPILAHATPGFNEPWGKDADLKYSPPQVQQEAPAPLPRCPHSRTHHSASTKMSSRPSDGPRSHFRPSSSSYMMQSMQKHGFIKGFLMGCDRLMRENSDDWVYRKIEENGKLIKYDPPR